MSDQGLSAPGTVQRRSVIDTLEIDVRLLGMLMAFAAVAVVFTIWTGGTFVGPRNVFNIAVQTVPVAIMACGMVFVIVARHIDLSVGSMLAMCSAIMAMSQTAWLPSVFGTEYGNPAVLAMTVVVGLAFGTLMGAVIVGVFRNGLTLMGVSSVYQVLVTGILVILAVATDQMSRKGVR